MFLPEIDHRRGAGSLCLIGDELPHLSAEEGDVPAATGGGTGGGLARETRQLDLPQGLFPLCGRRVVGASSSAAGRISVPHVAPRGGREIEDVLDMRNPQEVVEPVEQAVPPLGTRDPGTDVMGEVQRPVRRVLCICGSDGGGEVRVHPEIGGADLEGKNAFLF